jgi:ankyrin repeat protein
MQGIGGWLRRGGLVAACLLAVVSCRKPADASKSELSDAGYALTTPDLMRAAGRDDVPALKKFAAAGFGLDARDDPGDSALHSAAAGGARNAADFLLRHGLSIDVKGAGDRTPLMAAVMAKQTETVSWLLRQGADPRLKDAEGYSALMLAVRTGAAGAVAELAPYQRESLDSAILLAALVGQADAIDTLTNYGASVYARMDDGRTPLMIAAENGHAEAVELLLDIGASRFSTDGEGRNAADHATAAGHPEIAALILREPQPQELALDSPAELAAAIDAFVETSATATTGTPPGSPGEEPLRQPVQPIEGRVLSASVRNHPDPALHHSARTGAMPPIVMRHYREREVPLEVRTVSPDSATLVILGKEPREVTVHPGDPIPGSRLNVVRLQRRMEDSKLNLGQTMEVSVVEVRDSVTGISREWISGVPASAHDPVALIEDSATGLRYTATPGQRFKSADGAEFIVSDVRPNQIIIEDAATGAVQTLPLRGPRG